MCRGGETGRHAGFKIRFLHGSAGSIPALGTILMHCPSVFIQYLAIFFARTGARLVCELYPQACLNNV